MTTPILSELDRDRVALALRRIGQVTEDLRREYPEAFETAAAERKASVPAVIRPAPAVTQMG